MHFHRDMLATCDSGTGATSPRRTCGPVYRLAANRLYLWARRARASFPLRVGASELLLESHAGRSPGRHRTAWGNRLFSPPRPPTARCWASLLSTILDMRKCVSAGEPLPKATFDAWHEATGINIMDGIGATEMMHIFIGSPRERHSPGSHRQAGAGL